MGHPYHEIISALNLDEKISLLGGVDFWRTFPIERLDIPPLKVTDGPNGARGVGGEEGKTSASFPVGAAMGATWNTELIGRVGKALAQETKSKGAHVLLGPTVNIHRLPTGGRNFESFSEDPFLAQQLAISYIEGLQNEGVGACVKHYACNDQDFERYQVSTNLSERALREIYLLPFEGAVRQAGTWTVMSAYNKVNGVWASESKHLLLEILKEEWGFDGMVISDWYGTYSPRVTSNGLDLEMPGPARWMTTEHVKQALDAGEIDLAYIDDQIRRLLRTLDRTHAAENVGVAEVADDRVEHRSLIRDVGGEAIVLLKNEGSLLPLDLPRGARLAVIGQNAKHTQFQGGGSSMVSPHYLVSPLEAIKSAAGERFEVKYAAGSPMHKNPPPLSGKALKAPDGKEGLLLTEFFNNLDFSGDPDYSTYLPSTEVFYFGMTAGHFDPEHFSLRISGEFQVENSGKYALYFSAVARSARLTIEGQVVAEFEDDPDPEEKVFKAEVDLEEGKVYPLVMEYITVEDTLHRFLRFGLYQIDQPDPVDEAVALAKTADQVVIVAGLTPDWEAEGFDRPTLHLPNRQDEMIERIAEVNSNVVVVLNAGSPVAMPWLDKVSAVLQSWYLGQETGNALADVLFGRVNPSGKLPTTIPRRLEDNPGYGTYPGQNLQLDYAEDIFVGYRYYEKHKIEPLFPFGFGLSYSRFTFDSLDLPQRIKAGETARIRCDLSNIGEMTGKEVVQVYVRDVDSSLERPEKELKAFQKVALEPGQTMTVTFELDRRAFTYYDEGSSDWVLEPGEFEILIGSSSADIHLNGFIDIEP